MLTAQQILRSIMMTGVLLAIALATVHCLGLLLGVSTGAAITHAFYCVLTSAMCKLIIIVYKAEQM